MNDYSQPDFYRFNSDSIELINFVTSRRDRCSSILDLGAGSGVIGIELAIRLNPQVLDLVEHQKAYEESLKNNLELLPKHIQQGLHFVQFSNWKPVKLYDVIVCNPPYYLPGHGKVSSNEKRNIARSFVVDNWNDLSSCIERSLNSNGTAFIVLKNDQVILIKAKASFEESKLQSTVVERGDLVFFELKRLNVD
jgi:tRNA1Val (adenine37-N6)-methyltransferase